MSLQDRSPRRPGRLPGTLNINELGQEVQELFCRLEKECVRKHCDPAALVAQSHAQDAMINLCAMLPPDHVAAQPCQSWPRSPAGAVTALWLGSRWPGRCAATPTTAAQLLLDIVNLAIRLVDR